ncbi:MAG TPA: ABC transporter permease [Terracidiphilus sp.]|nr:ABC transporter permease [Terracidiphilus sp.]
MLIPDIRYALRQLRKSPGFTLTAVITLALGIGANTAIFTLVNGILLRSLPVADPSQLYRIGDKDDCCVNGGFNDTGGDFSIFSYDLYLTLRNAAPEFEQLAAVQAGQNSYYVRRGETEPRNLRLEYVTGNYFSTLGIGPYIGRALTSNDDKPGAAPAVEISYASWQSDFGGDSSIVGSTIFIQTHPFTVAGVAPPGFFGDRVTDRPAALWIPLNNEPNVEGPNSILHHADTNWLYPIGRLHSGSNVQALNAKLSAALRQFLFTRPVYAEYGAQTEIPKQHVVLAPGGGGIQNLQQETHDGLNMLMALSSVVLLIACANIANLLLARGTARRSDVAVRMALGAARMRLVRQMLTESILLAFIGGLAGLAVAYGGSQTILALAFPDARNIPIQASPSLGVLGFAFLVSLVTGVLFGIAPAWLSSHAQPAEVLRGQNRSVRDRSSVPQKVLVVFQAALSVVLLAGAILMTRSLANLQNQSFGIQTSDRYVFHLDPAGAGYTIDRLPGLYRQIEDRFAALPGVKSVALSMYTPLEGNNWSEGVFVQGHPAPRPNDESWATWDRVSPSFLDTIGVPLLRGRGFTQQDTASTQPVAIVNQSFVKRFFPNEDPVGRRFGVDSMKFAGTFEIVGVIPDFKMNDPREAAHRLFLRPITQQYKGFTNEADITGESRSMFMGGVILRFNGPQQEVEQTVRRTLASIDPNLTITDLRAYDQQVADNFNQERLIARLSTLFGVLALILACVGLYGVMSYFVARRTSEIGIRMALGATRRSVVVMVLRGEVWQIVLGLILGIPASLYAGYLMKSLLYGVGSFDPMALTGAPLALVLCAALAAIVPARRAASIEPMRALRTQ